VDTLGALLRIEQGPDLRRRALGSFVGGIEVRAPVSPTEFVRDSLGHDVWTVPQRIMDAVVQDHAQVAVKSCHSSGKTFTSAELALYWVVVKGGICITTAPTNTQVRELLWGEINAMHAGARTRLPGQPLTQTYRLSESAYALGLSTNQSVRFQGFHGDDVLVILDEAPGVRPDIYNAIEGIRAGGNVRVLQIGNPVVASGPFYDAFTSEAHLWTTFTISAFDTPNFQADDRYPEPLTLATMQAWLAEGRLDHPRLDYAPRPYLVRPRWVFERLRTWGVDHPEFQARVLGAFPDQAPDALVALSWCEGSRGRPLVPSDDAVEVGIDVAGPGTNETVAYARQGPNVLALGTWDDAEAQGPVIAWLHALATQHGVHPADVLVKIDAAGMGAYFVPWIAEAGFTTVGVQVGGASSDPQHWVNKRAEYYMGLRDRLKDGDLHGLTDTYTIAQLTGIRWRIDPRGRSVIESKDDMARRGVASPDRADALMLAFAPVTDGRPVIALPRRSRGKVKRRG
jgi:hypothetical protein